MDITRRKFLESCAQVSALVFGSCVFTNEIAEGFNKLSKAAKPQLIFIHGQSCTGCSISTTYGNEDNFIDFVTRVVRLQVHPNLSFSQGKDYLRSVIEVSNSGSFILVVEGSIPATIKKACMFGNQTLYDYLHKLMQKASAIVASGTCACYGGVPASGQNLTGAMPVDAYMREKGVHKPLIKIPGCPVNPDRLMGTVAYIVGTGKMPAMKDGVPKQYYPDVIHNQCGRYQAFNQDRYTENFETTKHNCLLKNGCRGPITFSDCPTRRWNGKVNFCIESNTPCIGCINKDFPFKSSLYLEEKSFRDKSWSDMKKQLEK